MAAQSPTLHAAAAAPVDAGWRRRALRRTRRAHSAPGLYHARSGPGERRGLRDCAEPAWLCGRAPPEAGARLRDGPWSARPPRRTGASKKGTGDGLFKKARGMRRRWGLSRQIDWLRSHSIGLPDVNRSVCRVETDVLKRAASSFCDPRETAFPRVSGGVDSAAGPRMRVGLCHERSQLGSAIRLMGEKACGASLAPRGGFGNGASVAPREGAVSAALSKCALWYNCRRGRFAAPGQHLPFRGDAHGYEHRERNLQRLVGCDRNHRPSAGEEDDMSRAL